MVDSRPDREDNKKEEAVKRRDGGKDKNSPALPRTVRSPLSSSLPPPFLLSSGEGSLGEIQTLQECYHCIALAAFPGSFNRLQTPLLHRAPVFVPLLIRVCAVCLQVLVHLFTSIHFSYFLIYLCIFLHAIKH